MSGESALWGASHREGRRVVVVAYACHPEEGSEPGAGWAWLSEIARLRRVVLVTRAESDGVLLQEVARRRLDVQVEMVATPLDRLVRKQSHARYLLWVFLAGVMLRKMERSEDFVAAHHLTYASDWMPSPILGLRRTPLVWGPVGGSTYTPWSLLRLQDFSFVVGEFMRRAVGSLLRAATSRMMRRRSALVVALNRDTSKSLRGNTVVVEPNVALDYTAFPSIVARKGVKRCLCVGRLIPLKGVALAIEAFSDARLHEWSLRVIGAGPEESRLRRLAGDLCVDDRVTFLGGLPRDEVLSEMGGADTLLFPSLHDSAPWAVAEAVAMGLRVVAFPFGGAADIAGEAFVPINPGDPIESIVSVLTRMETHTRLAPDVSFSSRRIDAVVTEWYAQAADMRGR